jgi:hypothetical protein
MDRDRSRVLVLLVAYLGLLAASLFLLDWFVATTPFGHVTMDLRIAHICPEGDACVTASLGSLRDVGFYSSVAGSTFWGTLVFSLLVVYQAVMRVTSGIASERLSKIGYLGGMMLFGNAFAAGFLFAPESGPVESELMSLDVSRTSAPFLMLLGLLIGIAILYYAVTQPTADDVGQYKPLGNLPVRKPTEPPFATVSPPMQKHTPDPGVGVAKKHTSSPGAAVLASDRPSAVPTSIVPEHLRKKLRFMVLSAEITRAGIDARREDGSSLLVMWRDVVGLVARRMPQEHDALTFIDVVSVAGSTLRLVPWTRLSGDPIVGAEDPRVLLAALVVKCPDAAIDPATKKFLDSTEPAAQLPDLGTLAAHDGKLA